MKKNLITALKNLYKAFGGKEEIKNNAVEIVDGITNQIENGGGVAGYSIDKEEKDVIVCENEIIETQENQGMYMSTFQSNVNINLAEQLLVKLDNEEFMIDKYVNMETIADSIRYWGIHDVSQIEVQNPETIFSDFPIILVRQNDTIMLMFQTPGPHTVSITAIIIEKKYEISDDFAEIINVANKTKNYYIHVNYSGTGISATEDYQEIKQAYTNKNNIILVENSHYYIPLSYSDSERFVFSVAYYTYTNATPILLQYTLDNSGVWNRNSETLDISK